MTIISIDMISWLGALSSIAQPTEILQRWYCEYNSHDKTPIVGQIKYHIWMVIIWRVAVQEVPIIPSFKIGRNIIFIVYLWSHCW